MLRELHTTAKLASGFALRLGKPRFAVRCPRVLGRRKLIDSWLSTPLVSAIWLIAT